jgi:hypothetical protein
MKYSKLNNIVKYYEKNQEEVYKRYSSYVYDQLNSEGDTSKVTPEPYVSYIIGRYSIDTYFKSVVKKGKGDYPTGDLMKWVRNTYTQLDLEYRGTISSNLEYSVTDMLKYVLDQYDSSCVDILEVAIERYESEKLEEFIETI